MSLDPVISSLRHLAIVDDSDLDAELLEARVRDFNPALERVSRFSSQQGLATMLSDDPPDLLVCDYHMGSDDTPATLRAVRERLPLLPILVMSGLIGEEQVAQVLTAGANDFVPKSRSERLRQILEHLLRAAAQQRAQIELSRSLDRQRRELEAVYGQAPIGMWKVDPSGRLTEVNAHGRSMMGGFVSANLEEYGVFEGWWYESGARIKDDEWPGVVATTHRESVPRKLMRVRTFRGDMRVFDCGAEPLTDADGQVLGALIVASDQTEAVALRERLAEAERSVRRASVSQIDHMEDHIAMLSRELHDDIGQMLSLVKLRLADSASRSMPLHQRLSGIAETQSLVEIAIERLRQICTDLRPAELIDFGLGEGLRKLVQTVGKVSHVDISFDEQGTVGTISKAVQLAIYRVAQQALTNVLQHADASHASVTLRWLEDDLILVVRDNGKGTQADPRRPGGHGIRSMVERIELLGGRCEVAFEPAAGVTVTAAIPRHPPGSEAVKGVNCDPS